MNERRWWTLIVASGLALTSLLLVFLVLDRSTAGAAINTGWGCSLWGFDVYRGGTSSLTALDCDLHFPRRVIEEKLRPRLITDPDNPLVGSIGPSAFENREVRLALRHVLNGGVCEEWEQLSPSGSSPPTRTGHTAIYDEANQQMTVFAGHHFVTDVHTLDLTSGDENWMQLFPPGPSPWLESGHTAVYDADNGRMIVWGGKHATTDTYALDLTPYNEKWMTLTVIGTPPEGRTDHTAVYDADNGRMIVFAGYFGEYPYFRNDAWALYLPPDEEMWEEILPAPDSLPPSRAGHTAIYDGANQRMIVFGGVDYTWRTLNDVWALYLTAGEERWEGILPSGSRPAPRVSHTAICDARNERMIIFGGYDGHDYLNDVWALDLTAGREEWHRIFPSGISPAKRAHHSAVYDAANERMVIFGGEDNGRYFNDIYALNVTRMCYAVYLPLALKDYG